MEAYRVEKTALARADIEAAAAFYAVHALHVLPMFLLALDQALKHLSQMPLSGSGRYGQTLNIPNLRHWAVKGFPYVLMYTVDAADVLIVRCLHAASDIPMNLQDDSTHP